ncbi:SDR family NAD(P)-dependent oxidoreductase (plasmid) [Coraliomargarita sp. W4R53]
MNSAVNGRLVVLAGGTSEAGRVVAQRLLSAGANVVIVGSNAERLARVADDIPGVHTERCDLRAEENVRALAQRIHTAQGPIDGLLHLVGGWRGGGGLAGQSDDDFRFLESSFTALRNVTRAFDEDLTHSGSARLAIVSSTAVARPLAGGANYVAVKAASEAWTRAVAQGFAKNARDASSELAAAAVIFRVKSLAGLEAELAESFAGLWDAPAGDLNDTIITLPCS